jgi:hypothetical protein
MLLIIITLNILSVEIIYRREDLNTSSIHIKMYHKCVWYIFFKEIFFLLSNTSSMYIKKYQTHIIIEHEI